MPCHARPSAIGCVLLTYRRPPLRRRTIRIGLSPSDAHRLHHVRYARGHRQSHCHMHDARASGMKARAAGDAHGRFLGRSTFGAVSSRLKLCPEQRSRRSARNTPPMAPAGLGCGAAVTSVLQREAEAIGDDPRAKAHVIRADERTRIALKSKPACAVRARGRMTSARSGRDARRSWGLPGMRPCLVVGRTEVHRVGRAARRACRQSARPRDAIGPSPVGLYIYLSVCIYVIYMSAVYSQRRRAKRGSRALALLPCRPFP